MRSLALQSNRLSGDIPRDLGRLTNLTSLILRDNRLSGEIPSDLGNLDNLVRVYLSNNPLTGCVPAGLRDAPLNDLHVSGTSILQRYPQRGPRPGSNRPVTAGLRHSTTSDGSVEPGGDFSLFATVESRGVGRVESTILRHYINGTEIATESLGPFTDFVRTLQGSSLMTAPTQPGTYSYRSCVDPVPGESDTTNNCSGVLRVTVTGSPDLVVRSISVSNAMPDSGEMFRLNATVRNQGNGATDRRVDLNYYRSSDRRISPGDKWEGVTRVSELGPGDDDDEFIRLTAPSDPGTYYYGACVEAVPDESNTANNCSTEYATVSVSGQPDLIVRTPQIDNTRPATGSTVTLTFPIRNQGNGDSDRFSATAYRSRDRSIGSDDVSIRTLNIGNLEAGSTLDWVIFNVNVPTTAGTYYYGACVSSVANESNSRNNCSTGTSISAVAPPDLVVPGISLADLIQYAGTTSSVTARVYNQGQGSAGSSNTVRFYRSESRSFSSGNQIGTRAIRPPGPSSDVTATLSFQVPTYDEDVDTTYYAACVDQAAGESNTGNNCSDWISAAIWLPLALEYTCGETTNFFGAATGTKIEGKAYANRTVQSASIRWKAIDSFNRTMSDKTISLGRITSGQSVDFEDSSDRWALFDRCEVSVSWRY